jgi:integrase
MARGIHRLKARYLERLGPGKHSDGGNLYLLAKHGGAKSWLFIYTAANGKRREIGLGPVNGVSMEVARALAAALREALHQGQDPQAERDRLRVDAAPAKTFRDAAAEYIASHRAGWKNVKHAQQWCNTLETYAYPTMGALSVSAIGIADVLEVLKPIWATKPETAARVRGRIEVVLSFAKVRGWRSGENPALWKGNLDHLLPARNKVRRVKHHAAMTYRDVPAFLTALADQPGVSPQALRFVILTAARTGEALGARWAEVDAAVWTVLAERMKAGREHRVPLSGPALDILRELPREGEYVFPGMRHGRPLSQMALLMLLRRMGVEGATVHGFRSAFRDWAAEQTGFLREVIEAALAHANGDKVEAAYLRTDHFEKRRLLMAAWGDFCTGAAAANVEQLRA